MIEGIGSELGSWQERTGALPLAPVALHHHGGCRVPFSTMVAPATLLWCPTLPFPTALGGCHHQLIVLVKGRNRGPKSTQLPLSRFI